MDSDDFREFAKFVSGLTCVALGMFGLYTGIEYSGWVLATGILAILFT